MVSEGRRRPGKAPDMQTVYRNVYDKDDPYLKVSKKTVRDREVSFEARGFLMFLLAKPDDWQIRPEEIARECGLHRATVYRLLKKLREAGYVQREDIKRRKLDGTFDSACLYTVFESKSTAELYAERIPF
jgi:DNA-binding transcriptional ArsR family regulator